MVPIMFKPCVDHHSFAKVQSCSTTGTKQNRTLNIGIRAALMLKYPVYIKQLM